MRSYVNVFGLALLAATAVVPAAKAALLYDNTSTDLATDVYVNGNVYYSSSAHATLEDATFGVSGGPYDITGLNIGYNNFLEDTTNVDLLVQFFDTATYGGPGASPIPTNPIGSSFRFNIDAIAGAGETGFLPISGIQMPDNNLAIVAQFVNAGTNTQNGDVYFLYKDAPAIYGSSNNLFGVDLNDNGTITSSENLTFEGGGYPAGNMYMSLQGNLAVQAPEPASMAIVGLGVGATVLRRRK